MILIRIILLRGNRERWMEDGFGVAEMNAAVVMRLDYLKRLGLQQGIAG